MGEGKKPPTSELTHLAREDTIDAIVNVDPFDTPVVGGIDRYMNTIMKDSMPQFATANAGTFASAKNSGGYGPHGYIKTPITGELTLKSDKGYNTSCSICDGPGKHHTYWCRKGKNWNTKEWSEAYKQQRRDEQQHGGLGICNTCGVSEGQLHLPTCPHYAKQTCSHGEYLDQDCVRCKEFVRKSLKKKRARDEQPQPRLFGGKSSKGLRGTKYSKAEKPKTAKVRHPVRNLVGSVLSAASLGATIWAIGINLGWW